MYWFLVLFGAHSLCIIWALDPKCPFLWQSPNFGNMCRFGFGGSPLFSLNFVFWKLQNLACASLFFSMYTNECHNPTVIDKVTQSPIRISLMCKATSLPLTHEKDLPSYNFNAKCFHAGSIWVPEKKSKERKETFL